MLNDKLKLNYDKTEFIIIGTLRQLAKVSLNTLRVGAATITFVSSARNLVSWIDSMLTMAIYISKTCNSAFYSLYNPRRTRKYRSKDNTNTLFGLHWLPVKFRIEFKILVKDTGQRSIFIS